MLTEMQLARGAKASARGVRPPAKVILRKRPQLGAYVCRQAMGSAALPGDACVGACRE